MVQLVKNLPATAEEIRDAGSIPGSGRYPGGGNGNPLQYSWLRNLMTEELGGLHTEVFLGIKWHMSTTYSSNHQEKKNNKIM